ncbi:MAG: NAD(P)H-dependent oxidoreductase, partial [bacterium]|nr:NAD(P)H-dependent oxidoreductase [bacterium]
AYKEADVVVFASPIKYFTLTAQLEPAIQRVFCIGKPTKAQKFALLLTSGSPGVYDAAIAQLKAYSEYAGIEYAGAITAHGAENGSEAKLAEIREFAAAL